MSVDFRSFIIGMNSAESCFCIQDNNGKTIYSSDNYEEVINHSKIIDGKIYNHANSFYSPSKKELKTQEGKYTAIIFKDITSLYQELTDLKKDGVTELPVRRELDNYISKVVSANSTQIFVMCDIDDFKNYNDTYGHVEGDYILKKICENFQKSIRFNDYVGRYGGEEFLIIFNTDNEEMVESRLDDIRKSIRMDKDLIERGYNNVTFSAGIAKYRPGDNADEIIKQADEAVYCVKKNGKNGDAIYDKNRQAFILIKKR